jgi:magnesium-transporting ATPase (P-type)
LFRIQLLWVNLIMDTLGALALATEPPTYEATTCWTEVGNLGLFFTLETLSVKINLPWPCVVLQ